MSPIIKATYLSLAVVALRFAPTQLCSDPIPADCRTGGFAIGCQAYTFNRFTFFEAIEKSAAAGGKIIELPTGHKLSLEEPNVSFDHNASDAVLEKVKAKLAQHHLRAVNYGVIAIPKDEAAARKIFEFARKMGLYAVITESVDAMDTIEQMVKEFDIRVGIHNHPRQPNNPSYQVWDPNYVLSVVKDRDPRIGACADTGHWVRSGLKPVECLRLLQGRIVSGHLKDLDRMGPEAHDVPFGTGVADIPGVLDELKRQGFVGNLAIEYEYNWTNSLPEVAQCIGFVRGYGARK
ncbi:MAG TPA: sugar phosphate isomerase/epimerase [Candidatus Paceibacterota bacterium]|nr:sugar phosphate isomerase/epimerase [Verrucomicrobiota bacterium]HRY50743.1 sugar phosphate isomerase/epimerase [Candidatus Paceibacterota bacterium]HSA03820.1 sugar phosphate isomerase/epimerase [Candidatus Paceibacterota bacterium]